MVCVGDKGVPEAVSGPPCVSAGEERLPLLLSASSSAVSLSIRSSWKQLARPALSDGPGWDGHELGVSLRLPRSGPQDQRSPGDVPFLPSERLTVLFHAVPSKGL